MIRAFALLVVLSLPAWAGLQPANSGLIGTLPTRSTPLTVAPRSSTLEPVPLSTERTKLKPGQTYVTPDGVAVVNKDGSKGKVVVVSDGSTTTVQTYSGADVAVSGIDSGDSVNLGADNDASVSGTGGSVSVASSSTVTVTNTNPPGGSETVLVQQLDGTNTLVFPGETVTIVTD